MQKIPNLLPFRVALLTLLIGIGPAPWCVAQDGVYTGGLFELGDAAQPPGFPGMGDVLLNGEQAGPDWEDLFDASGSARDSDGNGLPDYQELYGGQWALLATDDVSLGSGFESTALFPDGRVYNSTASADHDIGNVYIYSTADSAGNTVLFVAAERLGGGDSHMEFEFNQGVFRLGHGGYGKGVPWEVLGTRQVGDLLVKASFAGGALATVDVSAWGPGGWTSLRALVGEGCDLAESVCAICNAVGIDGGPWPNYDTGGDPELISANRFVELGFNAGALLGGPVDFTTVRVRTPEDTAFGYFGEGN